MGSLSHKRPRIVLLEKMIKKEISQIKQETFVLCSLCVRGSDALYQELKRIVDYVEEIKGVDFEPVCVSDSDSICLELNQDQKDIAMDYLDVGEQIICHALDDIEIPYHLSSQNRLANLGLHVTKNPGFVRRQDYNL